MEIPLHKMMDVPIEELADADVQDELALRFKRCMGDLAKCQTNEERCHVVGHAFKLVFVLGRWSMMILALLNTIEVWY